ncbi:MAG: hypothetical protein IT423_04620, partial [Pirellulaceae bacterium]|nr:hypothetical protein [Pirellulaceae bacterium]
MRPLGLGKVSLSLCIAIIYLSTTMVVGQVPVLNTVFPIGGQIGKSVDITVSGSNLTTTDALRCSLPGVHSERLGENRFRLSIPIDAPPGIHDLWASSIHGISAPRSFVISHLNEFVEIEPKEANAPPTSVELDSVINGVIGAASDIDAFQIQAKKDQRILIECLAERIDSRLRPVLAVHDHTGRRLAVNRGHLGTDALIDFHVPADGMYVIKVQDLILSGSPEHVYRLEIDTGPRVAFSVPTVVEAGKAARVRLFGWNLHNHRGSNSNALEPTNANSSGLNSIELSSTALTNNVRDGRGLGSQQFEQGELDSIEVDLTAAQTVPVRPLPVRLYPAQAILAGAAFPVYYPGAQAPVIIGLSDTPVSLDQADNQTPASAQAITVPCEISGQLVEGDQRDWFALEAKRGEVFWMEALGQRLAAPVDLQIGVFDARALNAKAEHGLTNSASRLALFSDEPRNVGGIFATNHLDPSGKWVCPGDGRYLVVIQNLSGGMQPDPRRVYRLSIRREEPDFQIVAVPQLNSAPGASNGPAALNVMAGSRAVLEILVVRRRGWSGPIRVFAKDLPKGIECPDVWLGPDTDQAVMIVTASQDLKRLDDELHLEAEATVGNRSIGGPVSSGTIVRSGRPTGWGRILAKLPLAVIPNTTSDPASKSPGRTALQVSANGHEEIHHQLYGTLQ